MKKKGFTLVEMIAIVSLLAIIALISIPIVTGTIKKSKDKLYNNQITEIISASKKFVVNHPEYINDDELSKKLNINTLINDGYISDEKIIDPRDDKELKGYVLIEYDKDSNSYNYKYVDLKE